MRNNLSGVDLGLLQILESDDSTDEFGGGYNMIGGTIRTYGCEKRNTLESVMNTHLLPFLDEPARHKIPEAKETKLNIPNLLQLGSNAEQVGKTVIGESGVGSCISANKIICTNDSDFLLSAVENYCSE